MFVVFTDSYDTDTFIVPALNFATVTDIGVPEEEALTCTPLVPPISINLP